jgi:prepilin-type N-terminal cleavage/methylation domain-containing protein
MIKSAQKTKRELGFTLIELLTAVAVLLIMTSLVTVNLAGFRVDRNLTIAQTELVTNIRKAQNYTLSARQVSGNQSGQFFILKFDYASSTQYQLQALYNITATPTLPTLVRNVETYNFPKGVQLSSTSPVTIYRDPSYGPTTQSGTCALVAFKAPFARVYLNGYIASKPTSGCTDNGGINDDYANLMNFVVNVTNNNTSTDSYAVITITDTTGLKSKKVLIRGVTGVVCPTQDGVSCSN